MDKWEKRPKWLKVSKMWHARKSWKMLVQREDWEGILIKSSNTKKKKVVIHDGDQLFSVLPEPRMWNNGFKLQQQKLRLDIRTS